MNWKIDPTEDFIRQAKKLSKKYRSLRDDLTNFRDELLKNPFQGDVLQQGIRKIRMAVKSKGGGKSKGARIITLTYSIDQDTGQIVLLLIYDHNQADTVDRRMVRIIAGELGYDVDTMQNEDRLV